MAESLLIVPHGYVPLEQKAFRGQAVSPDAQLLDGIPTPDTFADLTQAYNQHVWVYAACWAIASNYAALGFKAYRPDEDGSYEEYDENPMLPLLHKPNPFMSGYNLREFTVMSLELTGNAYWTIEKKSNGDPFEIWPVPSGNMEVVSSKTSPVSHYLYKVNGETIRFASEEVIHFKYMNPSSFVYGQGALESVKQSVISDMYAQLWNKSFFKNAARPDAVFETDQVMGDEVLKRVQLAWRGLYQGADKRGSTAILQGGLKLKEIGWKHTDMEFNELRKMSREEILAAFGVPPIMCGILEYANYANAKEQTSIFWKNTLMPKIRCIQDTLTMRIQQLTSDPQTTFESDTSTVDALRPDELQRAQTVRHYWQMGVPLNQIIDKFDLPFDQVEGGDVSRPSLGGNFGAPETLSLKPKKAAKKDFSASKREMRAAKWKAFDAKITPLEQRFTVAMRGYFRAQARRVKEAFEKRAQAILSAHGVTKANDGGSKPTIDVSMFFDAPKEQKRMREVSQEFISGTYADFAVATGKQFSQNFHFNMQDPHVLDWLNAKQLKLVREVTDYTMEQLNDVVVDGIRDALAEGFTQGETIRAIGERIDDIYQLANENRAGLIARTEIVSASNAGALEGMKQAGVEGKEWLDSNDDRVRESHQGMDGQRVPIDQDFQSPLGAHLNAPGDPSAPAEEVINCRCTVIGVRDLDEGD